jgi:hypothetical protein
MSKPVLLSQTQLTELGAYLPAEATLIGGVVLSSRAKQPAASSSGTANTERAECVQVIYATDDGDIRSAIICGSGSDFEITDDHSIGHT